ncbi:CHASE2 domain-containing protein [Methylomicrobium lacus]|uniref:CHASE2 domain-containing protein n=1 Tax=Methylomicrobium lacus TaxID=136992 RepID=UPI0035A9919E
MHEKPVKSRTGLGLTLLTIACAAFLQLSNPVPVQILRNTTFDQFQRFQPRNYHDEPVRIIDIDDESLKRLGQWPWPRTRLAKLLAVLKQAEPKAIAFDILFAEADRTSPQAMLNLWPVSEDLRRLLAKLPDHDQIFAEEMTGSHVILGFSPNDPSPAERQLPPAKARFVEIGGSPKPYLPSIQDFVAPLPPFETAAEGIGALTFIPDADGIIRKIPLLLNYRGTLVPALAAEALRIAQQAKNYTIVSGTENGAGIGEIRIGKMTVPTTAQGEIWIHYTRPEARRFIPAWQILSGNIPAASLQGGILLVGASAQGLMDLRFSPLGDIIPGIEIHAQALEQMLSGSHLLRPSWSNSLELLIVALGGLAVGLITLNAGALASFGVFLLALASLWLGAWQAYQSHYLLVDPMVPSAGLGLVFLVASVFRHLYSERRQRWVKEAFARYISPNRVEHLIEHPEALELGGRRQVCSFVFSDLADFTGLMECMDPGEAVALLNHYLDEMIAIAFLHHGTLDRIVGDAVAIMFSAPLEQKDHQRRALECAIDMQRFARRYSQDLNAKGIRFGQTRIGVHTGEVIVGNFGGNTIFDYRALGDPVNTASRLEGANKYLGTSICVSEATLAGCPDLPARPIGRLRVKGKTIPLQVFEPLDAVLSGQAALEDYLEAYRLMREEQPGAIAAFRQLAANYPGDSLVAFHWQRLRENKTGDLIELSGK